MTCDSCGRACERVVRLAVTRHVSTGPRLERGLLDASATAGGVDMCGECLRKCGPLVVACRRRLQAQGSATLSQEQQGIVDRATADGRGVATIQTGRER